MRDAGVQVCGVPAERAPLTTTAELETFLAVDEWAWSACDGAVNDICSASEPLLIFQHESGVLYMRCGHFCGGHSTALCALDSSAQHPAELRQEGTNFTIATGFDDISITYAAQTFASAAGPFLQLQRGALAPLNFQSAPRYVD